jgi:cell division septation protein DedD
MGLGKVEPKRRRVKRMRIVILLALAGIAAVALMGHAVASMAAEAEAPAERVTVDRDGIPVYSHMATTGIVVMQLMRGDVVEIERVDTTSEGAWCKVREVAIWGRSGFVRCEDLRRRGGPAAAPPTVTAPPKADVPPAGGKPPEAPRREEEPALKPTVKVTEPTVSREKRYTVQVAALVVERNALTLKARLEQLGFRPNIRTTTAPITRHRVYAGEFGSREEAERIARRLNVDGFPSNLVEGEHGKFRPEVGSFFRLDGAIDLAHDLQEKNYTSKIVSRAVPTRIHAVRVGIYPSRPEALEALEALKTQGFAPVILRQ